MPQKKETDKAGDIRRSQMVQIYGPGAIVNLRYNNVTRWKNQTRWIDKTRWINKTRYNNITRWIDKTKYNNITRYNNVTIWINKTKLQNKTIFIVNKKNITLYSISNENENKDKDILNNKTVTTIYNTQSGYNCDTSSNLTFSEIIVMGISSFIVFVFILYESYTKYDMIIEYCC